ncbi:putative nucleophile aminohydrolase [Arabidopsis thaliana]|jgi:hypothetical protein|uniref:DUF3700 domain-containing protein n=4 Tax=Arabidopsis TaxID=3701 RepID=A0A178U6D3_ARATH|nr:aluminum induced protein with YGL and LRDR motifs [Arabidopsis thaliana]KAG7604813.1 hypothetical protein ISN45_At05g038650 [Arabidopsis thaliana x Arabidopsis arenosa]KAG7612266.1 hypothetical protein ISN44_As05g042950 [Arabidopsis suecica]AAK76543.1 putative aluminum-induced protein [Arabidopsis thaliana]AAM51243.1 putative aluminum-induced protein [Arabidopsis thaliana]AAM61587.1 aluminum-induced protein-like [Arabidopsis thaliana]|eukprot:NP_199196.1 aluminum induced protein with YGL and LRDR motifs [Arabidopsis thaliana]
MLAVFEKTVANSPEALQSPHSSESAFALKDGSLATHFASVNPNSVTLNFGSSGFVAYSLDNPDPRVPRLFAVVDDIFCLFQGHIENLPFLKQQYGLNKITNEAIIVIEAYRTLRDRGPYPVDKVVRDFHGKFAFILFDSVKKTVFAAADADGSVPFFWGTDAEGHLVFSDNTEMVKKGCAKSYGPFPKGCFFTSSGGLRSFEHPKNELKPVPRVDSSGDVCGATFKVDAETKREGTKMPRVDSSQNWAGHI